MQKTLLKAGGFMVSEERKKDKSRNIIGFSIDPKTNLLRADHDTFVLEENENPELYEHIFPYDLPPMVEFNLRHVPMNTPENLWMTDTTFRDGQQAILPWSSGQIKEVFRMMGELGGPKGMIRQSEFFLYTKKDREALEKCRSLGLKYPEITGWVRASKKDFELVKNMELKEVGILTSVSDYHTFIKLGKKRSDAINMYLGIARDAIDMEIIPRCHFEDITKADFYGFVVPFAKKLMELSKESGMPVKIRMCDTLGIAVPYSGASLPLSVPGIVYGLNWYSDVPSECLEWHGHNDFGYGKINAVTAWLYGCSAINGAMFGIGERTGNTAIEQAAVEYCRLKGNANGMKLDMIGEMKNYFEKELKLDIHESMPHAGDAAFQTSAGIHIDGLTKGSEKSGRSGIVYLPMSPLTVGNREKVVITDKSGIAGVVYKVNELLGLAGSQKIEKTNPGVLAISRWIDEEYSKGRATKISDEEMLGLIDKNKRLLFGD